MKSAVRKSYLAVVAGQISPKAQTIAIPLALQRDRGLVAIRMIADSEGKSSCTRVRPIVYDRF